MQHNVCRDFDDFYPRSPCGERRCRFVFLTLTVRFLSTLSLRRATNIIKSRQNILSNFYPRSPCGERQRIRQQADAPPVDFYPRSPCGERLLRAVNISCAWSISIHALLAESDALAPKQNPTEQNFYPRSPCGERPNGYAPSIMPNKFLSTLSLRRATGRAFWPGLSF